MSFNVEIRCTTNGLVLAKFPTRNNYFYRLAEGTEFQLRVNYAWCFRCDQFVEVEKLYSVNEIQQQIDELLATKEAWTTNDATIAELYANRGLVPPISIKSRVKYETWQAVLAWRLNRRSGPRCLQCGSFFAIKILPTVENIKHPSGQCTIRVGMGDHAYDCSPSENIFYDAEGLRLS